MGGNLVLTITNIPSKLPNSTTIMQYPCLSGNFTSTSVVLPDNYVNKDCVKTSLQVTGFFLLLNFDESSCPMSPNPTGSPSPTGGPSPSDTTIPGYTTNPSASLGTTSPSPQNQKDSTNSPNDSLEIGAIITISIVGFLIIATLVVIFAVPSIRAKLFPRVNARRKIKTNVALKEIDS